jgi:hypothetical protein
MLRGKERKTGQQPFIAISAKDDIGTEAEVNAVDYSNGQHGVCAMIVVWDMGQTQNSTTPGWRIISWPATDVAELTILCHVVRLQQPHDCGNRDKHTLPIHNSRISTARMASVVDEIKLLA